MRVLLLTQYLALGGLERMIVSLAQEITKKGHICYVVAYENQNLNLSFVRELQRFGVETHILKKRSGFSLKTVFSIREIVKAKKIKVLHSHDLGALIYSVLCSFTLRNLSLVHTQHSFVHFKKNIRRYRFYERFFTFFVRSICTVSEALAQKYLSLGVPGKKIHVIPNGIHFSNTFKTTIESRHFLFPSLPSDVVWQIPDPQDKNWLVALGRIAPGKGLERLLKLWRTLPSYIHDNWILFLIGPEDEVFLTQTLRPLAQDLQDQSTWQKKAIFAGATQTPSDWYFAADAFVSLSEYEGMPLASLEALLSGLPLLLSEIDGHKGMAQFARYLPADKKKDDKKIFQEFLEAARSQVNNRATLWTAREPLRREFGAPRMAERYLQVYSGAVKNERTDRSQLLLFFIIGALIAAFTYSGFAQPQQQLSALTEKPEYLRAEDFAKTISLSLRRGESKILTLKNNRYCGALPKLKTESASSPITISWFRGHALTIAQPSFEGAAIRPYIDALIPIEEKVDCALANDWLFAEITVRPETGSQTYSLELISEMHPQNTSSRARQGEAERWLLDIQILPFDFDSPWTLPLTAEFTPYYASLAHFGRSTDQEGVITRKYVESMISHRILPLKAWIRHPFKNSREQADQNFLLSRDPLPQLSFGNAVVGAMPHWAPIDLPRIDSPDPSERLRYWSRWQSFFDKQSADTTEAILQRRMSLQPFVYLWDEPTQEDFRSLREMAESVKAGAPAVSTLVTIYPWSGLLDAINIFAPLLQTLEREGKPKLNQEQQLWSYVSCMSHGCGSTQSSGEPDFVIERNASYIRVWPWMANHYELKRVLYYSVNNAWRKSSTVNPWEDLWDFSGNGDGTLFYPGLAGRFGLAVDTPIASLRMKIWRQASFDADYLAAAKKKNPICVSKLLEENEIVHDAFRWSRDSRLYEHAREALIRCLLATQSGFGATPEKTRTTGQRKVNSSKTAQSFSARKSWTLP